MWFFCDASATKGNGCLGSQWYHCGKSKKGTTRQIIPYCICSSNQSGIWLLIISLSFIMVDCLSCGRSWIYVSTVVALLCIEVWWGVKNYFHHCSKIWSDLSKDTICQIFGVTKVIDDSFSLWICVIVSSGSFRGCIARANLEECTGISLVVCRSSAAWSTCAGNIWIASRARLYCPLSRIARSNHPYLRLISWKCEPYPLSHHK